MQTLGNTREALLKAAVGDAGVSAPRQRPRLAGSAVQHYAVLSTGGWHAGTGLFFSVLRQSPQEQMPSISNVCLFFRASFKPPARNYVLMRILFLWVCVYRYLCLWNSHDHVPPEHPS